MFKKIKDFLLKWLAGPLISQGSDLFEAELRKMAIARPKLFKTLVVSCHTAAKEYGPALVASSATNLDDDALKEFVEALEKVANEFDVDLDHEAAKAEDAE